MKKIIIAVIVALVVIVGCVFLFSGNGDDVKTSKSNKKETFGLKYENVDITPGVNFKKDKIKKEAEITVVPSCAIDGNDNNYKYDNIEITTNDYGDKEVVYSVYFLNDSVKTNEGVKIGDSKDDVKKAYPDVDDSVSATYTYDKDGVRVMFHMEDDVVKSIEYIYIFE